MSAPMFSTVVWLRSRTTGEWFVDPGLRDAVVADAAERGTSIYDVTAQAICEAVRVPYTPTNRPTRPEEDKEFLRIRVPKAAHVKLKRQYENYQDGIRQILSERYGLPVVQPAARLVAA